MAFDFPSNIRTLLAVISISFIVCTSSAQVEEYSQDFTSPVAILDGLGGLSGDTHAYTWSKSGAGLTATPDAPAITQSNNQILLEVNSRGPNGAARLHMVGSGTDNARRTAPVDHEAKYVFDLISFRDGQADLTVRSRGLDGYAQLNLSPAGRVKFSHWHINFQHATFNTFNGPSQFRQANGIIITSGGTFDGTGGVTVVIGDPETADGVTATANVVMNAENTEVVSVTMTNVGSGYTDEPTVVFSGGGVSVQPEFTFTFETGNVTILAPGVTGDNGSNSTNNKIVELGSNVFNDGSTLTLVQSYDSATDTITYYYGLNDDPVTNVIMTLDPAINSAGGYGFFNVVTGNKWIQPRNQDAIYIQYQQWGTGTAQIGFNSYALEFTDSSDPINADTDGDGVSDSEDTFPNDPNETVDTDNDGVGDNADALPNDPTESVDSDADGVGDNADTFPNIPTQDIVNDVLAKPWVYDLYSRERIKELSMNTSILDVSNNQATLLIQMEESSDLETWTETGDPATMVVPADSDTKFFRFKMTE